jgi:2-oxoglutarate dehydrogenase E1 component
MLRRIAPASALAAGVRRAATQAKAPYHKMDTLMTPANLMYLASIEQSIIDGDAVDPSWVEFFRAVNENPRNVSVQAGFVGGAGTAASDKDDVSGADALSQALRPVQKAAQVLRLIAAYHNFAHARANLDPLQFESAPTRCPSGKVSLEPARYGLTEADLDMTLRLDFAPHLGGLFASSESMTVRELVARLDCIYTGRSGWEYAHVADAAAQKWLRDRIETPEKFASELAAAPDATAVLKDLADGVAFEQYLHVKYGPMKRFGSDGGESMIAGLRALINRSVDAGQVQEVVLGMAHRGRLSTLVNVCGKPFEAVLKEFEGIKGADMPSDGRQGDVKYHLGWRSEHMKTPAGAEYAVRLMYNPSHLEAVNPLLQGQTRALQDAHPAGAAAVLPIEMHGDAAVAGQGVVYETMGLSEVRKYTTGGTVHVVVNNQVGYTTNPIDSRSSRHASDIGRVFQAPVFHVNGDAPEDVVRAFALAADYRRTFQKSVVIELMCYRRRGHNEGDDPSMTQPQLYQQIAQTPDVFAKYKADAVAAGKVTAADADAIFKAAQEQFKSKRELVGTFDYKAFLMKPQPMWEKHTQLAADTAEIQATGVSDDAIREASAAIINFPEGYDKGTKLETIYAKRVESLQSGKLDFGTAEAMAWATLLKDGFNVRLSGQDVQRGTFNQRHFVVHNTKTFEQFCPLQQYAASLGTNFRVTNSTLSEYGTLGYDTGYAMSSPRNVVMWEAQFGDFCNGAQIIMDQFITSGQAKWGVQHNVIVSLPHGYDGQGAEHSSGRMERVLQMAAEDELSVSNTDSSVPARHWRNNVEVVQASTPAQYFHVLRRHALRNFARPLFLFTSKERLKVNVGSWADFTEGTAFQPVVADVTAAAASAVKRVVLVSGQLYWALADAAAKQNVTDVAIVRVDQIAPFPVQEVLAQVAQYPEGAEVVWAQQEPKNQGPYSFVAPRLAAAMPGRNVRYVGRVECAAPSTGSHHIHHLEHENILHACLA